MSLTQHFNLNIIPDSGPVVVHVDQYDHGEGRLVAHLYNGSTPYSPSGASAMIQGTKPDGNFYMYSCDIVGNTVTANLEEIMTQVCGRVRTQFVVTDGDNRTGTFVFELDVQSSALNGASGSESIIEYIEEAIEKATEEALDSEAWAKGTRDNVPVESTDPTYQNNSKYYSEQADTSATNAANSESAASDSAEDAEAWAVGERAGVPVTSGDPTYHNNAEYWADVARQAAGGSIVANSETETSAHAYAIGDQFIYNGILYTATASISIGGTIAPGTNCSPSDTIVDQLADKADLVGGKVPSDQLPSYVDDVIEGYYYNSKFYKEAAHTTEITPETGKIYVDLSTDMTYRWSGSAYIALSNPDIANDAVTAITASTAQYPVPAVNELLKVIIGKINKFLDDLKTKKADKVSSATNGNIAALDSNGNLTDSGKTLGKSVPADAVFTDTTYNVVSKTANGLAPQLPNETTTTKYLRQDGTWVKPPNDNTKNTAGATDSSSKLFLIGATSQSANPQTYSQDTAYVGTDGCLYSDSKKVSTTDGHTIVDSSGTSMTQRGNLKFVGATTTDDSANNQTVVTLTGGGHAIENASGTVMTQRSSVQFTSKVSDDSGSDKTIVYSGSEENITIGHTTGSGSNKWVTENNTIDGTVYPYRYSATLTKAIYGMPKIEYMATKGSGSSSATATAFNCIAYVGHDVDYPTTLKLYATAVPTVDFNILVKWEGGEV